MTTNIGIRRVLDAMDCLSTEKEVSFSKLREHLAPITAAGVSRVMKVLLEEGWVEKNRAGLYRPADRVLAMAHRLTSRKAKAQVWTPVVRDLAAATGESAICAAPQGQTVRFLIKHEAAESFHYRPTPSGPLPLNNPFVKVCLAFVPPDQGERIRKASPAAEQLQTNRKPASLAQIAEKGYAIEYLNGLRIVAPILREKTLCGAIGITTVRYELKKAEQKRLLQAVQEAARHAACALK